MSIGEKDDTPHEAETQAAPQPRDALPKPPRRAEPDFLPWRGILFAGGGLLLLVGLAAALSALTLGFFARTHTQPPVPPVAMVPVEPPPPRLETTQLGDRPAIDAAGAAELGKAGWADAAHTRARLPIGRAMEILAARGWPDPEPAP